MTTNELILKVVNAGTKIHKQLGSGLTHDIYEDCIVYELAKQNIEVEKQRQVSVKYENLNFPSAYSIDLLVEKKLVVCLKPINIEADIFSRFVEGYMRNLESSSAGLMLDFSVSSFRSGVRIIEKTLFKPVSHPLIYTEYQYGKKKKK